MECTAIRDWMFRKIDGELSDRENEELNAHLAQCTACAMEFNLLALPHRIASAIPAFEASTYFSQNLSLRIVSEAQNNGFWLAILNPARRIVPALACITFLLLSIFAYVQLHNSSSDFYTAYDRVFVAENQPNQMLIKGDIPDENILSTIYQWEDNNKSFELK
jgi:predicted anti-sigma-YlaC factor YlaD